MGQLPTKINSNGDEKSDEVSEVSDAGMRWRHRADAIKQLTFAHRSLTDAAAKLNELLHDPSVTERILKNRLEWREKRRRPASSRVCIRFEVDETSAPTALSRMWIWGPGVGWILFDE